jgi:hypothetical protein
MLEEMRIVQEVEPSSDFPSDTEMVLDLFLLHVLYSNREYSQVYVRPLSMNTWHSSGSLPNLAIYGTGCCCMPFMSSLA